MTNEGQIRIGHWGLLIGHFFLCQCNIEEGPSESGPELLQSEIMTSEKNQTWLPVVLIAGALIGWMGLLAAGAYWAPVGEGEAGARGGDPRKLWVVAATTGCFLLLWGVVLLRLRAKIRRKADSDGNGGR